jgi:hypothetical protein
LAGDLDFINRRNAKIHLNGVWYRTHDASEPAGVKFSASGRKFSVNAEHLRFTARKGSYAEGSVTLSMDCVRWRVTSS